MMPVCCVAHVALPCCAGAWRRAKRKRAHGPAAVPLCAPFRLAPGLMGAEARIGGCVGPRAAIALDAGWQHAAQCLAARPPEHCLYHKVGSLRVAGSEPGWSPDVSDCVINPRFVGNVCACLCMCALAGCMCVSVLAMAG